MKPILIIITECLMCLCFVAQRVEEVTKPVAYLLHSQLPVLLISAEDRSAEVRLTESVVNED